MNINERPDNTVLDITIRLTDHALSLMDEGASLQAALEGKSPSRAAWFRHLIDSSLATTTPSTRLTPDEFRDNYPPAFFSAPVPNKAPIRITEHHRILLRQHECFIQSLDWTREIYRNEACLHVIDAYGPFVNLALTISLNRRNKKTPHSGA